MATIKSSFLKHKKVVDKSITLCYNIFEVKGGTRNLKRKGKKVNNQIPCLFQKNDYKGEELWKETDNQENMELYS